MSAGGRDGNEAPFALRALQNGGCCGQLHKSVDKPRAVSASPGTPRWACPPIAHLTTARRRRDFDSQIPEIVGSALRAIAPARVRASQVTGHEERA